MPSQEEWKTSQVGGTREIPICCGPAATMDAAAISAEAVDAGAMVLEQACLEFPGRSDLGTITLVDVYDGKGKADPASTPICSPRADVAEWVLRDAFSSLGKGTAFVVARVSVLEGHWDTAGD